MLIDNVVILRSAVGKGIVMCTCSAGHPRAHGSQQPWRAGEEHSAAVLMGVGGHGQGRRPRTWPEEARDRREGVTSMSLEGALA